MPNRERRTEAQTSTRQRIGTSFRLNSTTALALSRPRKVGAESSPSYTVTGKGAYHLLSFGAHAELHAATSSYFSRCSRSRAQRVLTSRLSGSQRKAQTLT